MEEGTSKAIPLRRSRNGTRAVAVRPQPWAQSITAGVRYVLEPPRQLWLASLGGTALTVKAARFAWSAVVAEGVDVDGWLRRTRSREPGTEPRG